MSIYIFQFTHLLLYYKSTLCFTIKSIHSYKNNFKIVNLKNKIGIDHFYKKQGNKIQITHQPAMHAWLIYIIIIPAIIAGYNTNTTKIQLQLEIQLCRSCLYNLYLIIIYHHTCIIAGCNTNTNEIYKILSLLWEQNRKVNILKAKIGIKSCRFYQYLYCTQL